MPLRPTKRGRGAKDGDLSHADKDAGEDKEKQADEEEEASDVEEAKEKKEGSAAESAAPTVEVESQPATLVVESECKPALCEKRFCRKPYST